MKNSNFKKRTFGSNNNSNSNFKKRYSQKNSNERKKYFDKNKNSQGLSSKLKNKKTSFSPKCKENNISNKDINKKWSKNNNNRSYSKDEISNFSKNTKFEKIKNFSNNYNNHGVQKNFKDSRKKFYKDSTKNIKDNRNIKRNCNDNKNLLKNNFFQTSKKLSYKERQLKKIQNKEDRKKYYKKTDENYLSKRFKREYKDDISHKPKSPLIRLNKYLYEKNICSRREADKYIEKGLILVNKKKAVIGQKIHPLKDKIKISDSLKKEIKNKIVVVINKPKGYVSENPQKDEKEVSFLLPFTEKLSPIGRLDKNTTGVLLLTNDGKIVNDLLNPNSNHEKEYTVVVDKRISSNFLKKMKDGVDIGGYITKKAKIRKINENTFSLIIIEGKNHQIKKMTNALGYTVRDLKRTKFNNIKLQNLKIGKYRIIEGKEYLKLIGKF